MVMVEVETLILEHARTPYDPVKRREYYLRTRQLKGRRPGGRDQPGSSRPSGAKPTGSGRPSGSKPAKVNITRKQETAARVHALQNRIQKLREVLRDLVKQAIIRSGVDPSELVARREGTDKGPSKTTKSTKSETRTEPKEKTATQKKEAAKASKEYYEEHKKENKDTNFSKQEEKLQKELKQVREKIDEVRNDLKASVDKARKEVKKNRPSAKSLRAS